MVPSEPTMRVTFSLSQDDSRRIESIRSAIWTARAYSEQERGGQARSEFFATIVSGSSGGIA